MLSLSLFQFLNNSSYMVQFQKTRQTKLQVLKKVSWSLWTSKIFTNLNAKVLISQVKKVPTTNFGLLMTAATETTSALWASRYHILEDAKTLNAITVKSSREKSFVITALVLRSTTNVI